MQTEDVRNTSANPRVAALGPSGIRSIFDRKRSTSIDLSIGQPSLKADATPFEAAARWIAENGCPYPPYAGIDELRAAVAAQYGGPFCSAAANACITNGSQEALYLAVKTLLDPTTDEVLVTNPGYPSYTRCCDVEGVRWHAVAASPENGFRVTSAALLEAMTPQTRMIMLGSPANPSGAVISPDDARELSAALRDRPGPPVWVVVDEVYRELVFTESPYESIIEYYEHAIVVHSLSKSCALTGLRLGFFIGPASAVRLATRLHQLLVMSVSVPAQRVALEIFQDPDRLRGHVPWYRRQRAVAIDAAKRAGVSIIEPEGAFYALVRLPPHWHDSAAAANALLDRYDVVTVPGAVFGSQCEGFLRATWAADERTVVEGFNRIGEFVRSSAS